MNLNIKLCIFFLCLIFSAFTFSINRNSLIELQATLTSLANKTEQQSQIGFIGKSLIGKKFKDIFAQEQLKTIVPTINGNDLVLISYDQKQNIYQLKSLQQTGTSCGAHAFRNCLWIIEGLSKDFNNFTQSYLRILDQNSFDKYFEIISCGKKYFGSNSQKKNIREGKVQCIESNKCLPLKSEKYLGQIFEFTYSPLNVKGCSDATCKIWRKFYKLAQKKFREIEPKEDINKIAADASIFIPWIGIKESKSFYDLIIKDNFCLGLDLDINKGELAHGTCLIAHKMQNQIEYLFLDSMNLPYTGGMYNFIRLIEPLKRFLEDPEIFKNALIRRAYVYAIDFMNKKQPFSIFMNSIQIFLQDQFKDLNLTKTNLYQIYKPHFCKFITSYMEQDLENKKEYEEILRKINCS